MTRTFKGFGEEPTPTKVTTRSGLTKHLVESQVMRTDDLSKWAESDQRGMPVWWMPDQQELQCWWYSVGNPQQIGDEIHCVSIPMGFAVHFDARGVIDGFIGLNDAHDGLSVGSWPGDFPSARKAVSEAHPTEAWQAQS